ncbi:hypothetical protein KUTeg_019194 [Tegillarca granosa]|uniref:EF-hand domain-containing protein n=1 Tax=Tegillarca granosa TaxID=220873 RepID=A0ABQ9EBU5_TEGGR|nr:hypothetical protein KUTeg_019194 [Tegillarca granosa]
MQKNMKRTALPRQRSLVSPEIQNPFTHQLNLSNLDFLKIAIFSFTLVPLRLILIGLCLVCGFLLAKVSLVFRPEEDKDRPLTGWRKSVTGPLMFLGRAIGFFSGFHNIKVKGIAENAEVAPMLIVAPHSSFFDAFVIFYCTSLPSIVSRKQNAQIPLIGTLMDFTQPVYVSREDPNSRINTIKEIQRRAQSGGQWPQIIIFPEGTCTNRTCLINFKPGAFYPGVAVQPVTLKYPGALDTITWTWDGPGAFACLWLTLCNINNSFEIEFLPVYTPSEEEKKDAKLFASNVRQVMARALEVPVTDHTYDDCRLMEKAAELDLPMGAGLVEFHKLNKKLGVNFDHLQELLQKFSKIAKNKEGNITLEEFSKYLCLPKSESMLKVFELYDRNESGKIDFREYVIGLSLISSPVNTDETIRLAFELFDSEGKGYIGRKDLCQILQNAFEMEEVDTDELFNEVDSGHDDKITIACTSDKGRFLLRKREVVVYDAMVFSTRSMCVHEMVYEFTAYAMKKPEYAKLFITYQELKNQALNGKCVEDNGNGNNGNGNHIKSE